MPKPVIVVDYHLCQVENCGRGICLAALNCPRRVLRQEAPFEMPEVFPGTCKGCGLCAPACPFQAIRME